MHFDAAEQHQEKDAQIGQGDEDLVVRQPGENRKLPAEVMEQDAQKNAGDQFAEQ